MKQALEITCAKLSLFDILNLRIALVDTLFADKFLSIFRFRESDIDALKVAVNTGDLDLVQWAVKTSGIIKFSMPEYSSIFKTSIKYPHILNYFIKLVGCNNIPQLYNKYGLNDFALKFYRDSNCSKYTNNFKWLKRATKQGNLHRVKKLINTEKFSKKDVHRILIVASQHGHFDIIKFLLK